MARKIMLTLALVTLALALAPFGKASATSHFVKITLGTDTLANYGIVFNGAPYISVSDLARNVNGTAALSPRLEMVNSRTIYGIPGVGCALCTILVRNSGVISSRVISIDGQQYLPLADLATALGSTVQAQKTVLGTSYYSISAVACSTCVLFPAQLYR